jgi:hypothetical protein
MRARRRFIHTRERRHVKARLRRGDDPTPAFVECDTISW